MSCTKAAVEWFFIAIRFVILNLFLLAQRALSVANGPVNSCETARARNERRQYWQSGPMAGYEVSISFTVNKPTRSRFSKVNFS